MSRQMVGRRKGAPALTIAISNGDAPPDGQAADPSVPEGPENAAEDVTCPKCGCTFDPESETPPEYPADPSAGGGEDAMSAVRKALGGEGA